MDAPPILSARLRSRFHCRAQPDARRGEAPRGFRTVQSRCAKGHDPRANVQVWDAHAGTLPVRLGSLAGGDQSGRLPHVLLLCHGADTAGHRRQLLGHGQGPGLPRRQLCWRGHGRTERAGRGRARPMRGRALRARRETAVPAEGARGRLWDATGAGRRRAAAHPRRRPPRPGPHGAGAGTPARRGGGPGGGGRGRAVLHQRRVLTAHPAADTRRRRVAPARRLLQPALRGCRRRVLAARLLPPQPLGGRVKRGMLPSCGSCLDSHAPSHAPGHATDPVVVHQ
mmetsp:Transcript_20523/g.65646  ORF Transcript_20523/g.65646 Transcript_20523/m.65646 type:complete len:283 (+) Transcript_20523:428-1276(+)